MPLRASPARSPRRLSAVLALAAFMASQPAALAAAPGAEPGWTLAPYGWLAGLDGTIGAPGGDTPGGGDRIDVSLDPEYDLVGFMFYGEWRGERWMAYFDSVWANFQQDATLRIADALPGTTAEGEVDGNIYTLALGYRLRDWADASLTVFGGARHYDLDAEVILRGGLLPSPVTTAGDDAWTDAIAGARWSYRWGDGWHGFVQGDVGAGDSDLAWQVFATLAYRFDWGSVVGGYRHLAVDYEKSDYRMDIALSGPLVGVSFTF